MVMIIGPRGGVIRPPAPAARAEQRAGGRPALPAGVEAVAAVAVDRHLVAAGSRSGQVRLGLISSE